MNDILNTQEDQAHDTKWIKDKIADIKDRSCRNNIKIHGILELVQPTDLSSYARGLIKAILPDTKNIELVIDRLHRLPKPAFLSDTVPRNIILRIQFYHVKEQFIQKTRALGTPPDPYGQLKIFADLSQHTLSRHRQHTLSHHQTAPQQSYPVPMDSTRHIHHLQLNQIYGNLGTKWDKAPTGMGHCSGCFWCSPYGPEQHG